jgi:hypothetical protein
LPKKEKLDKLRETSPSVIRNSIWMFVYRIAGFILALALTILGIVMLVSSTTGCSSMSIILGEDKETVRENYARLSFYAGIAFFVTGILCAIISRLAAKLIRRNMYIIDLEHFARQPAEDAGQETSV